MPKLKKYLSFFCFTFFLIFFTSCQKKIEVWSDYLTIENLASFYVNTPDPCLNYPPLGERLLISWSLTNDIMAYDDLHLSLTVRLRNGEEILKKVALNKNRGIYIYQLINRDFFDTGGILTYKVQLVGGDCILEETQHQLWTELIILDDENEEYDITDFSP